jgi:putative phosphoesterase
VKGDKMKLLIASDLHGSAYYCTKLLEVFKIEKPDKLLLLGDILYHGPRNDLPKDYNPKEVFEMLNSIKEHIICIRGNCDSEVDQMVLEFPIMADYSIIEWDKITFFATHGHLFNLENRPPMAKGTVLLNGHFHTPVVEKLEDFTYINPGSLALPKDGTNHSYLVYDQGEFLWKDVVTGEIFLNYKTT